MTTGLNMMEVDKYRNGDPLAAMELRLQRLSAFATRRRFRRSRYLRYMCRRYPNFCTSMHRS